MASLEVGRANIFRQPEVEHLDAPSFETMTLAGFRSRCTMPLSWAAASASPSASQSRRSERPARPPAAIRRSSGSPFHQLHGQKVDAVGFLDRVDRDDVRVVELGERLGLPSKAAEPLGIPRHLGGQHLEGDVAAELRVVRAIDLAHATRAEGDWIS